MKPEKYAAFYSQLNENGIKLVTSPSEYKHFHIFPNVYPEIVSDTAKMIVFSDGNNLNVEELKKKFNRFMIKDYVKSVKGTSFPKYLMRAFLNGNLMSKWKSFIITEAICIQAAFV